MQIPKEIVDSLPVFDCTDEEIEVLLTALDMFKKDIHLSFLCMVLDICAYTVPHTAPYTVRRNLKSKIRVSIKPFFTLERYLMWKNEVYKKENTPRGGILRQVWIEKLLKHNGREIK